MRRSSGATAALRRDSAEPLPSGWSSRDGPAAVRGLVCAVDPRLGPCRAPAGLTGSRGPADTAGPADLAVGAYAGNVISDSKGSSRSDVLLTIAKVDRWTVRVVSDYAGLGATELDPDRRQARERGRQLGLRAGSRAEPAGLELRARGHRVRRSEAALRCAPTGAGHARVSSSRRRSARAPGGFRPRRSPRALNRIRE